MKSLGISLLVLLMHFAGGEVFGAGAELTETEPPVQARRIPFKEERAEDEIPILKLSAGLVLAALATWAAALAIKKHRPFGLRWSDRRSQIRVLESTRLSPRLSLFVVVFEQERFMLAASDSGGLVLQRLRDSGAGSDAAEGG